MGDHTKTLYPKGLSLSTLDSERDQVLIAKALAEVLELHKVFIRPCYVTHAQTD